MAAFFIAYQTREEVGAMAQRGRKPKPTALKMLEGNPGGRPLNTKEPKPEKKAPRCPSWLEDEAKKEWKRMAKVLENMGLLTEMDMAAFAGYCQAYARWKEACLLYTSFTRLYIEGSESVWIQRRCKQHCRI